MKIEMDDIRQTMATKDDLKEFATKDDLVEFATKKDVSVLTLMHSAIIENTKLINNLQTVSEETQEEVRQLSERQINHGFVLDLLKIKAFDNELLLKQVR